MKGKIVKEYADAAYNMFEALGKLTEESVAKHLENTPELLMKLLHQAQQIETKQQQFQYDFKLLKQQIDVMTSMNSLLENAGKINHLLSQQHYDDHIIQPLVRSVFPLFDIIDDARKCYDNSRIFDALLCQLRQFLAVYNVKVIKHSINDKFDPKLMKPIKWLPTADQLQDGLVAESMQIGFCLNSERILRLETVALFKCQPSEINSINFNQGAEQC